MPRRPLALPTTLVVSLLAAGCSGRTDPSDVHADDAVQDVADETVTCPQACSAMFSPVNPDCAPELREAGIACIATHDGGSSQDCQFAMIAMAGEQACCCYPTI